MEFTVSQGHACEEFISSCDKDRTIVCVSTSHDDAGKINIS